MLRRVTGLLFRCARRTRSARRRAAGLARRCALAAAVLLGPSLAAAADGEPDCFAPGAPGIPDGAQASYAEMVRVQQLIKLYRESGIAYTQCMDDHLGRFAKRVPERRRERWIKERQKVADALQKTTEAYNAAVRAFQAKSAVDNPGGELAPASPPPPSDG